MTPEACLRLYIGAGCLTFISFTYLLLVFQKMRNAANKICCVLLLHIFGTSINLALLGGNGNTLLENDVKIKRQKNIDRHGL
jgi:hypothetical protein